MILLLRIKESMTIISYSFLLEAIMNEKKHIINQEG